MISSPSIILSVTPRPGGAALAGTRGLDKNKYYDQDWGRYDVEAMLRQLVLPAFASLRDEPEGFVQVHLPHGHDPADDPKYNPADPNSKPRFALQGPARCEQRSDMSWAWRGFADAVNRLLTDDQRRRLIFYTGTPHTMPDPSLPASTRLYRRSVDQYLNAEGTGLIMDRAGSVDNGGADYWREKAITHWGTEGRLIGVEGGDASGWSSLLGTSVQNGLSTSVAWMVESRWLEQKRVRIEDQVAVGRCCIALCQTWDGVLDRDRQAAEVRRALELGMVICLPHADLDDMAAKGLTLAGMRRVGVGHGS